MTDLDVDVRKVVMMMRKRYVSSEISAKIPKRVMGAVIERL